MKRLNDDPCHQWDKLGLFGLAALVVIVLGAIVIGTFWKGLVPDKGDVLLGGIATGLILFLRDLVGAVRAGWEEVTRGKTNEQLAKGAPPAAAPPGDDPLPVRVENDATDPVPVKGA